MESLHAEVAPFGIATTIVNPGFFRTELLTEESTTYAEPSIADYAERQAEQLECLEGPERPAVRRPGQARPGAHHDREPGAAAAPLHRRRRRHRDRRAEGRGDLKAQIDAYRELSTSLAFDGEAAVKPM